MAIEVDLPGARGLFTTREGGISEGPFATLNLGTTTGDDPAAVAENRRRLATTVAARPLFARQVHGTTVARILAAPLESEPPGEADGQATAIAGVAPAVLAADCLPILIAGGGAVAAVHAGWRGLAGGIVGEGVRAVRELGRGGPLAAAIGPGAGPCCYEVGDEVRAAFARHGGAVRHGRRIDLPAIAHAELRAAGVARVDATGLCTLCSDPARLFSHRRDGGVTGRQAGLAWLT